MINYKSFNYYKINLEILLKIKFGIKLIKNYYIIKLGKSHYFYRQFAINKNIIYTFFFLVKLLTRFGIKIMNKK